MSIFQKRLNSLPNFQNKHTFSLCSHKIKGIPLISMGAEVLKQILSKLVWLIALVQQLHGVSNATRTPTHIHTYVHTHLRTCTPTYIHTHLHTRTNLGKLQRPIDGFAQQGFRLPEALREHESLVRSQRGWMWRHDEATRLHCGGKSARFGGGELSKQ